MTAKNVKELLKKRMCTYCRAGYDPIFQIPERMTLSKPKELLASLNEKEASRK